jgi:hypothetical protein
MKKHHLRNNIQFCRYGTLSPVSHERSWQNPKMTEDDLGFHSPPCKKGLYAFVYPFIEKFLLSAPSFSGLESTHPKVTFIRDKQGNKFTFKADTLWEKSENVLAGATDKLNLDSLLIPAQKEELPQFLNKQGGWLKDIQLATKGEHSYLVKQVKPKIFTFEGEIWHHLELFLESRADIIQKRGSWVQTDFYAYKKALHAALGKAQHNNFRPYKDSWDHLEVFIEKI